MSLRIENRPVVRRKFNVQEVHASFLSDVFVEFFISGHPNWKAYPVFSSFLDLLLDIDQVSFDELFLFLDTGRALGHLYLAGGAPSYIIGSDKSHHLAPHRPD